MLAKHYHLIFNKKDLVEVKVVKTVMIKNKILV